MPSRDDLINEPNAVRDEAGRILHFGTPPAATAEELVALADHLAVIRVSGADAQTFLQGQVSADLRDVIGGHSRLAMHLSLKGRGLVSMRLLADADGGFLLLLPAALADSCLEKLHKFVLLSKAELIRQPEYRVLLLRGRQAGERLARAGLRPPQPGYTSAGEDYVLTAPGTDRWLLVCTRTRAGALWPELSADVALGGSEHARLDEILAGEGHVYPGGEDRFMPQELNYDLGGGISFNKGCYVGQEVVARMHFKGRLKQRMRHLSWPASTAPAAGALLRAENDKGVGEIVNAVSTGERCHALAVLRHQHQGGLWLERQALDWRLEALPYELPEE